MAKYKDAIIEEPLENKGILKKVKIISTKVEKVTDEHQTPWLSQWTFHTLEIEPEKADEIAREISKCLEREHDWHAGFNDGKNLYVIFRDKVFTYKRGDKEGKQKAVDYGLSLDIPDYQLDFP